MTLQLERDGAQLFPRALDAAVLAPLEDILPEASGPGLRLYSEPNLQLWLSEGPVGEIARSIIGTWAKPVRAILFDKTRETNWALAWHQDRTIAVRRRVLLAGFENWTTKDGTPHVEPPFDLIERMVTVRIHIDPVPAGNAPLLIAPGSHALGRVVESEIDTVVKRCGTYTCLANAGDAWLYKTAILHRSDRSVVDCRRRVLQVDFAAEELPGGLEWLGVG
jgi:Phytanoyl-CoA dioxygenase (PhyH)